jgi:hypothetical protein
LKKNTGVNLKNFALNTIKFILCFCILITLAGPVTARNLGEILLNDEPVLPKQQEVTVKDGVLKGGVSVSSDLPQEFYGTWSVVGILLDTNRPELFRMRSSDIWTFERKGDIVILSNPVSGASASITINEIRDKTAIFSRIKDEEDMYEVEKTEITVEEDSFSGTDVIITKYFKNGQRIRTDEVKYKVRGFKISGPTLKDIFAR